MFIHYNCNAAGDCLRAVQGLLLVAMTISSLQYLFNRAAYGCQGALPWRLQKYAYGINGLTHPAFDVLFGRTGFAVLHLLRIALMALAAASIAPPLTMTGVFALNGMIYFRSYLTMTAADQLCTIILVCLLICACYPTPAIRTLSLEAIAIHVLFCYLCNGVIKLFSPGWRDGRALRGILLTEDYSRRFVARWIARSGGWETRILGLMVVGWELAAAIAPLLPVRLIWLYLGVGVLFHLGVALVMGLNSFFWTFLSAYPAILFLNSRVFPVA